MRLKLYKPNAQIRIFFRFVMLAYLVINSTESITGQNLPDTFSIEVLSGIQGEEKVNYLIRMSQSMVRKDEFLGAEYALMAYNYAEEISRPVLKSNAAIVLTYFLIHAADTDDEAIESMLKEAEKVYLDSANTSGLINCYSNMSIFLRKDGKVAEALEYAHKAFEYSLELNHDPQISLRARNVGIIYDQIKNHEKSVEYFTIAYDAAVRYNDTFLIAGALGGLGSIYLSASQGDRAVETLLSTKELYKNIDRPLSMLNTLSNLANAYNFVGEHELAIETIRESIELANTLQSDDQLMRTYTTASKIMIDAGRYEEAKTLLDEAESLGASIGDKYWLSNLYHSYSTLYEAMGDYEQALHHYRLYADITDELVNDESQKQINELEVKFQTAQKTQQIQAQQLVLEQNENQRKMLVLGFSTLLVFGMLGVIFIFYRGRVKQALTEKEIALKDEKINSMAKTQKLETMHAIIQTQESERQRIARDLHDGLGGLLSSAQLHSSKLDKMYPGSVSIKNTREIIDVACQEVRKIAHNMMPDALIQLGLADTLTDIVSELDAATSNINFRLELIGVNDYRFDQTTEIMIYRIAQEAIQNILKHAEASKVLIQLSYHENRLDLHFSDNGKGMNPTAKMQYGLGMKNIISRVDFLKGEFEIQSAPGDGTQLYICIPAEPINELTTEQI